MPANVTEFNQYAEAFSLGFTDVYEDELKLHQRTYKAFLREDTAKRWYDTDWVVSGLGSTPQKVVGGAIFTDRIIKGTQKQYALVPYALGCVVEWEAMKWDWYGIFEGLPNELAKSAVERYNIVGHSVLNNSFSAPSTDYKTFQSENMVSTSHTRLDGGTWSNRSSTDVGLSYLGLQQARIDFAKLVNERGRYAIIEPELLITSADQRWIAEEILKSNWRPDNANQNVNLEKGSLDLYTSPYLTTAQYWWLEGPKENIKIKMRLGENPKLTKDADVRTMSLVMSSYCSFGVAIFNTVGLWGSSGGA